MRALMETNVTDAAEQRIDRTVAAYDAAAAEYQEAWRQRRPLPFGGRTSGICRVSTRWETPPYG